MLSYAQRRSVLEVGNFLSTKGYTRQVIEDLADRLELSGWFVYRTSDAVSRPIRLVDMGLTCWRKRSKYGVAHIDVFSGPAFLWAEVSARIVKATGKPYLLSLHGGNLPSFSKRWPSRVKRLLAGAFVVTVPSQYLLEQMSSYRGDLLLLPNPLNVDNYQYRIRRNIQPKLLWLRAFHEIYNPSLAPKVVQLLAAAFPEIHLTMVGPDKDGSMKVTKRMAFDLNIGNRLTFPGGVPKAEVPKWLEEGDIFLNTANFDNTPISILEAMSCGLCIVSTNVGGIPYLLRDEHNALLVPPDDPEAMARAVRRILENQSLAEKISRNARETVEQFDWSVILPQWESLITAAMSETNHE